MASWTICTTDDPLASIALSSARSPRPKSSRARTPSKPRSASSLCTSSRPSSSARATPASASAAERAAFASSDTEPIGLRDNALKPTPMIAERARRPMVR